MDLDSPLLSLKWRSYQPRPLRPRDASIARSGFLATAHGLCSEGRAGGKEAPYILCHNGGGGGEQVGARKESAAGKRKIGSMPKILEGLIKIRAEDFTCKS